MLTSCQDEGLDRKARHPTFRPDAKKNPATVAASETSTQDQDDIACGQKSTGI
jgi:hypothetical protein